MTQTWMCPKGHVSKDPDNCDRCGEQIQAGDNLATATAVVEAGPGSQRPATTNPDGSRTCHAPDGQGGECGQVNQAQDQFCQLCQASLEGGAQPAEAIPAPRIQQPLPPALPVAPAGAAGPSPSPVRLAGVSAEAPNGWELVAVVDRARAAAARDRNEQAIEVVDDADLCFPLVTRESLIGRRSDAKDVYPEVELLDPAVSRPHSLVRQEVDGSLTYVHLSAKSGSVVDGVKLTTGRSAPLHVGSRVLIGAYTEITVRAR